MHHWGLNYSFMIHESTDFVYTYLYWLCENCRIVSWQLHQMPRCEGLPSGPCPHYANGVKSTLVMLSDFHPSLLPLQLVREAAVVRKTVSSATSVHTTDVKCSGCDKVFCWELFEVWHSVMKSPTSSVLRFWSLFSVHWSRLLNLLAGSVLAVGKLVEVNCRHYKPTSVQQPRKLLDSRLSCSRLLMTSKPSCNIRQ